MTDEYFNGNRIVKTADNHLYIHNGDYTTCGNLEHPHFYFYGKNIKVIPREKAVTRPVVLNIGEVPVFTGTPFPANAQALSKSVLAFFPKKKFIALINSNPSLALNLLAVLSKRLRQFTVQVENLSLKEVPERLAAYLLFLSKEQGGTDEVTLPISKGQLASLLGTIPETLSRIFSKMSACYE